ncbi:MAG: N-6 DNA methylase, partial [Campylobacteraceae bacterium]|nr:N-6 DNA methylase [Campylobacteraceae bacterium]
IDFFDYDHSENLGDAFEYLLSILGSQGDAGQFRTPRHIIDFMVEVLEPKKNETVLDPACGTAGFLISAFKHIMSNNKLTPDEKKSLMQNFTGYDISPDMVRLSLVNMYLHSFPTPKIYEYDTLTSEERWNDSFDVILANPPFMTPKGGIRPHSRFSVSANRSEVLFVDYIAEHLNLNGRAAIIVPEGIIFQSANAYKALRKMLIENNFLWAVVSLPAGVFQPYSGVKTSVLLLDRSISKHKEDILFIKISNDGFELGAQRRESAKNDLPEALELLKNYRLGEVVEHAIAQSVLKTKIAESGDYNLTGDRYKENTRVAQTVYPIVKLGDVCEFIRGITFSAKDHADENYILVATTKASQANGLRIEDLVKVRDDIIKNEKTYLKNGDLLISVANSSNLLGRKTFVKNIENRKMSFGAFMGCLRPNNELILSEFLNPFLESENYKEFCLSRANTTTNISNLNWGDLSQFEIPLPPIEIQNEIVAQIEEWQKIIDGAKQVINIYRPTITIDSEWEIVKLGEVCEINPKKSEIKDLSPETMVSFAPMDCLNSHELSFLPKENRQLGEIYNGYTYFKNGDILIAKVTPCFENGKSGLAENLTSGIGFGSSEFMVLRVNATLNERFLYFVLDNPKFIELGKEQMSGTGGLRRLTRHFIENYEIPLPSLETQTKIVEQIEKEREAVESCKILVEIFETKIKAKIDEVWGNI